MRGDINKLTLSNMLSLELARVTEATAVAAAEWRGRGDEAAADKAAAKAMREALMRLPMKGRIVIGEGDEDDVPMLYIGEELGLGAGPSVDIAVDPLEGTTACAKSLQGALAVLACADQGGLLKTPDIYMDKIAIGPGYEKGLVDLDESVEDNLNALAKAKGVPVNKITACILDRPRHAKLIEDVREVGAAIRLISDGDIAGVINTTNPDETFIDVYLGTGGAAEGILAAAALRCTGGQLQARLIPSKEQDYERAEAAGINDLKRKYEVSELASGDVVFAATGITNGSMLHGVQFNRQKTITETVVMTSATGAIRRIKAERASTA